MMDYADVSSSGTMALNRAMTTEEALERCRVVALLDTFVDPDGKMARSFAAEALQQGFAGDAIELVTFMATTLRNMVASGAHDSITIELERIDGSAEGQPDAR